MIAWLTVLVKPAQLEQDLIANDYDNGSTAPFYSGIIYVPGDRVIGTDNALYECIANVGGIPPPNAQYWLKLLDTYIGVQERIKYNGQKLVLEFALNRFFRTVFRQPVLISDIYIENNDWAEFFYIGGSNDDPTSHVYGGNNPGDGFVINDNNAAQESFTIFIPESGGSPIPGFYTSLQPYADQKIRAIADKYAIARVLYSISTY